MESTLGPWKGSSLLVAGLGDGEIGWNPPWGLGKLHHITFGYLGKLKVSQGLNAGVF